jgi:cell division protein FtsI/penicillin-binding protein 2
VQVARFAVNQYRFPGVEVKGYKRRYYPYNSALTHVIGYVSKINDKDVDRLDKEASWLTTPRPTTSVSWVLSVITRMSCTVRPATKRLK